MRATVDQLGWPRKPRHREPQSGVAIQKIFDWIASSASPSRNDGCFLYLAASPGGPQREG
jgi:hypothetical protein